MAYRLPSIQKNHNGKPRSAGFEVEFAGLGIQKSAEIIRSLYGGKLHRNNRYSSEVTGTDLGDFKVELDAQMLQKMAREDVFDTAELDLDEKPFRKSVEEMIDKLAMSVVPVEVVMPPVSFYKLEQLEKLRKALQKHKAQGTGASLVHAFGMHINIESPDLEAGTLLRYLRAFMVMYPWLLTKMDIDISRRISPFVAPFPEKYIDLVLDDDYRPEQNQLMADYIEYNPTRNRPLDMMPIFGMLDNNLIEPVMRGEKNDPRPAFHYRLPNSKIDDPAWRFEDEWSSWLTVEGLARDEQRLRKLSRLYLMRRRDRLLSFRKEWYQTIQILLEPDEQE